MTVRDVMSSEVGTVSPDLDIWGALAIMRQSGFRHLVVVNKGKLVGLVSNRDYRKVLESIRPDGTIAGVFKTPVSRIMTPGDKMITIGPDASVLEAARAMVDKKIGSLPVLDGDARVVGILTQRDVMGALVALVSPRAL